MDPDEAALDAARAGERTLLAAYADGTDGHTVHLAHLRALGATLTTPTPGAVVPAGGVRPEEATVQPLMAAARNARRGNTAALLASIAASHAVLAGDDVIVRARDELADYVADDEHEGDQAEEDEKGCASEDEAADEREDDHP